MTVVLRGSESRKFAREFTNFGSVNSDPDLQHLQRIEIDSSRLMFFFDERRPIIEEHSAIDFSSLVGAVVD